MDENDIVLAPDGDGILNVDQSDFTDDQRLLIDNTGFTDSFSHLTVGNESQSSDVLDMYVVAKGMGELKSNIDITILEGASARLIPNGGEQGFGWDEENNEPYYSTPQVIDVNATLKSGSTFNYSWNTYDNTSQANVDTLNVIMEGDGPHHLILQGGDLVREVNVAGMGDGDTLKVYGAFGTIIGYESHAMTFIEPDGGRVMTVHFDQDTDMTKFTVDDRGNVSYDDDTYNPSPLDSIVKPDEDGNLIIDQSEHKGDDQLVVDNSGYLDKPSYITITNEFQTDDVFDFRIVGKTGGYITNVDLVVSEGVNAQLHPMWPGDPDPYLERYGYFGHQAVNLSVTLKPNSTFEYSSERVGDHYRDGNAGTVDITMEGDGPHHLILQADYLQSGVDSQVVTISGMKAGDTIHMNSGWRDSMWWRTDDDHELLYGIGHFASSKIVFDPETDMSKIRIDDTGNISYACYLKGTHIATPEGEAKVEDLKTGDKVLTASGNVATVKWLGHRTLFKKRIPEKDAKRAFPILFRKGCIADNVPHRDLIMSPGHHVFFDGNLVPAMALVNGISIVQQFEMQSFQYFHVELEQFDILLAEGVPAESYVDTGNRSMFQNAHEVAMNPDFGPAEGRPKVPGITVVRKGPVVEAIRAKLLERANWLQSPTDKQQVA
ncbi:Hint domain-containing protein [Advenella kashmirensis]